MARRGSPPAASSARCARFGPNPIARIWSSAPVSGAGAGAAGDGGRSAAIFGDFAGLRFFFDDGVDGAGRFCGEGDAPPGRLRDPCQRRIWRSMSARSPAGSSASVAGSISAQSIPAKPGNEATGSGDAGGGRGGRARTGDDGDDGAGVGAGGGAGRLFFGDALNSAVIGTGAVPESK